MTTTVPSLPRLDQAEGEGFEPSTDPEARNGFRDETRLGWEVASVQAEWSGGGLLRDRVRDCQGGVGA